MKKQRAEAQDDLVTRCMMGDGIDPKHKTALEVLSSKPHRYTVIVAGIPYSIEADYYGISDGLALFYKDHVKEPVEVAEFNASKIDGIIEEGA